MMTIDFASVPALWTGVCGIFFLIQLVYIGGVYSRLYLHFRRGKETEPLDLPPLSVIIVTKDSGEALNENLPAVLEQDYPQFEVIVVNDKSAGEDELILTRLAGRYTNLYHTFIPETARYVSRKKLGIAMGIRASRYDWIVVASPFGCPVSPNWLKSLAREMTPETDIVLGYSNYFSKKGYFARRITVDSFFRSLRYLCMALAGRPYMGIGNNLAYRKRIYLEHKGFSDHLQLQRGEDDLFINAVANRLNTRVACGAESIVRLPVPASKRVWKEEMLNAMVTGHYYRGIAPFLNALETWTCGLFHLSFLVALVVSILSHEWVLAAIVIFFGMVRFLAVMHFFYHTAWDLKEKFGCFLPFFDLFRPVWSLARRIQYLFCKKNDFLRK